MPGQKLFFAKLPAIALERRPQIETGLRALIRQMSIENPVCTENLNTGVVVMKSAQDGA